MAERQPAVEGMVNGAFNDWYRGKRVFVTGHSGFKGGWLCLWLRQMGAVVTGYSLPPPSTPSLHEVVSAAAFDAETMADVRDAGAVRAAIAIAQPDIVFHLAAQPLVIQSYAQPVDTFTTNALGTIHVLEAVRTLKLACPVIVVTSDKCYENQGGDFAFRESDPMGGHDVYSMSKGVTELVVASWRHSFFERDAELGPVATVRAGNVIGGGDYADHRIVPDCIRSLQAGKAIGVRNLHATRPWQHVLDCLSGYLCLGARMGAEPANEKLRSGFNFGPELRSNRNVRAVVTEVLRHWSGDWVDQSDPQAVHEAPRLNLTIEKAANLLAWYPAWDFAEAVRQTVDWYRARHRECVTDMAALSIAQISDFTAQARSKGVAWAVS